MWRSSLAVWRSWFAGGRVDGRVVNNVAAGQARPPASLLNSAAMRVGPALDRAGQVPSFHGTGYKFCANCLAPLILGNSNGLVRCSRLDRGGCCPFELQAAAAVCTAAGATGGLVEQTRALDGHSPRDIWQCRLQRSGDPRTRTGMTS